MIVTEDSIYDISGVPHHGTLCRDDAATGPRPGVLVFPAFGGKSELEIAAAERLAGLGYVALAADVYGNGTLAASPEEASALMKEMNDDRPELLRRLTAAIAHLAAMPMVDAGKMAAIGFCFGGKCVLDLARANSGLRGVASFHGVYDAPPSPGTDPIGTSVLVLHGWDDPLATPEQLTGLAAELTARKADWQVLGFGSTGHAFTNPKAAAPERGMAYDPRSNRRAWASAEAFLVETLTDAQG